MKHTKEEILKALHVIKDTCKENEHCFNCPFHKISTAVSCQIVKIKPSHWEIKKSEEPWRAFE